jgi:hypothetical protein
MNDNFPAWVEYEVLPSINVNMVNLAKRIQVIYNILNDLPLGECDCSTYELAEFDHLCLPGIAEYMQQLGEGIIDK